jgi:hypothetical protein
MISSLHALIGAAALIVVGCAATPGVLPVGLDTYLISVRTDEISGGVSGAHRNVLVEANRYCASLGRQILITNSFDIVLSTELTRRKTSEARTVHVTFRCLAPGDLELQRPVFEQAPTSKIEDRQP